MKVLISVIIIDYKRRNPYLEETLSALSKQTFKDFEVILICDHPTNYHFKNLVQKHYDGAYTSPAKKRDDGAALAKGQILAFLDDDAYPDSKWLEKIADKFESHENLVAIGGPGITPPHVSLAEAASGWVSASPLGSGPYGYRFMAAPSREVDDYPSMNLAVRKSVFNSVGGYDTNYWPGEDTKLCLDLINTGGKIRYYPDVLVYHHRRPLFKKHLIQNGQFGLHRGFFARVLPQTSARLSYFAPSALLLGWIYLLIASFNPTISIPILINTGKILTSFYLLAVLINSLWIGFKSSSILHFMISLISVPITHLWYGGKFIQGILFTTKLSR